MSIFVVIGTLNNNAPKILLNPAEGANDLAAFERQYGDFFKRIADWDKYPDGEKIKALWFTMGADSLEKSGATQRLKHKNFPEYENYCSQNSGADAQL